ncbi:hypothetical protein ABBQ38_006924 [Trebouxia sp. C0009 RCD-2024]
MDTKMLQGNYGLIKGQALEKAALNAVMDLQVANMFQPDLSVEPDFGAKIKGNAL